MEQRTINSLYFAGFTQLVSNMTLSSYLLKIKPGLVDPLQRRVNVNNYHEHRCRHDKSFAEKTSIILQSAVETKCPLVN